MIQEQKNVWSTSVSGEKGDPSTDAVKWKQEPEARVSPRPSPSPGSIERKKEGKLEAVPQATEKNPLPLPPPPTISHPPHRYPTSLIPTPQCLFPIMVLTRLFRGFVSVCLAPPVTAFSSGLQNCDGVVLEAAPCMPPL